MRSERTCGIKVLVGCGMLGLQFSKICSMPLYLLPHFFLPCFKQYLMLQHFNLFEALGIEDQTQTLREELIFVLKELKNIPSNLFFRES